MDLLISLLVIILIFGLVSYIIQTIPGGAPYKWMAQVVLAVIVLVWLIEGVHTGHFRLLR